MVARWLDREAEMTHTFESKSDVNERPSFALLPIVPVLIAGMVAFSTVTAAQNEERVKGWFDYLEDRWVR
jgi:hypothetical protein